MNEIILTIATICSVSSVKDGEGSWGKLDVIEKANKECRVYYYDCLGAISSSNYEKFLVCDRKRNIK